MEAKYNMKSPAVKRLMKEAIELRNPTEEYYAQPLEDNLFEWHFTVRGPPESDFDDGLYHGRIVLPPQYPMKPPSIILLTPNGRFETYKKICLSISGHHPESWQPSWSIRTALLAIIGFMPTHGNGAIGSLDYTPAERKVLAKNSHSWSCDVCGPITGLLLERSQGPKTAATTKEAKELAAQISFKGEADRSNYMPAHTLTSHGEQGDVTYQDDSQQEETNSNDRQCHTDMLPNNIADASSIVENSRRNFNCHDNVPNAPIYMERTSHIRQHPQGTIFTAAIWALSIAIAALLLRRVFFL